jgi:hypothetical protein
VTRLITLRPPGWSSYRNIRRARGVVRYRVPSKIKSIRSHPELSARLGSPGIELRTLERVLDAPLAARHRGWRWPCACSAFVRPEGDGYLWVPCLAHTGA